MPHIKILNIDFDNLTQQELLEQFTQGVLMTPNIDHLMKLQSNKAFFECYGHADFRVCDSRIIFLLQKLFYPQQALKEQITGSDFFPAFCNFHSQQKNATRIFLLGGSETSVVKAAENINQRAGYDLVVGYYSPPFGFEKNTEENTKILNLINSSQADTLAVGVGAPKQEFWIQANKHQLPEVKRFLAIGATIEFESGDLTRAPKWMTRCGLEWAYRLSQEPKRLARRYLIEDLPFFYLFIKQRLGLYQSPWEITQKDKPKNDSDSTSH